MSAADVNNTEFPKAVALATKMLPLVTVEAVRLPPVATTLVSVKLPLVAPIVMAPLAVVTEVAVSPPAVSMTLIRPAPETEAVSPEVALISSASLDVPIPLAADRVRVAPETSAPTSVEAASVIAPTDVKLTVVPAVTLPT